jgi:hypothetical protein
MTEVNVLPYTREIPHKYHKQPKRYVVYPGSDGDVVIKHSGVNVIIHIAGWRKWQGMSGGSPTN